MEFKENELVLVRRPEMKPNNRKWMAASYERTMESNGRKKHLCTGTWWLECIPYKLNEELLGTTMNRKDRLKMKWGDPCIVWHDEHGWREAIFIQLDEKEAYHPWKVILKPDGSVESSEDLKEYSASVLRLPSQEE